MDYLIVPVLIVIAGLLFEIYRKVGASNSGSDDVLRIMGHYVVEQTILHMGGRDRLSLQSAGDYFDGFEPPDRFVDFKQREWIGDILYFNAKDRNAPAIAERHFDVFRDYQAAKARYDQAVMRGPYAEGIAQQIVLKAIHMPADTISTKNLWSFHGFVIEASPTLVNRHAVEELDAEKGSTAQ